MEREEPAFQGNELEDIVEALSKLEEALAALDPARRKAEAIKLMHSLDFSEEMRSAPTMTLSGGWRMKVEKRSIAYKSRRRVRGFLK